jgi:hypothetical protein
MPARSSAGSGTNGDSEGHKNVSATPENLTGGSLVAVSGLPSKPALTQDFLISLFDQFAAVQNQMFDQFQQAMTMMVDMFSDMQREQVGHIRKEVDRLHQITEAIHTLQNELASQSSAAPPASAELRAPPGAARPIPSSPSRKFEEMGSELDKTITPDVPSPAARHGEGVPETPGELPATPEPADNNVHVWLYDKIAELQRERQSRVKRLFDFLRGK